MANKPSMVTCMMSPTTAIDRQRRQDNARGIGIYRLFKPVVAINDQNTVTLGYHLNAIRQTDEMPEPAVIVGHHLVGQWIDQHLGDPEIITK